LKYRVDALLLVAATLSSKLTQQCRDEGIPVISFGRRPPRSKHVAGVTGNSREGAGQMAQHLLQQGYRRLALMAGSPESATNREREAGFTAYLASQGLPEPEREVGHCQRDSAFQAARNLLSSERRPDAIFCTNDDMALATLEVARYEFGLDIGREIGIAGFDDIEEAAWPTFELTTYSLPMEAMIEKAVALLIGKPGLKDSVHVVVDGVLKPRRSTQRSQN
jgi:DNA-binding LacI/PurR family transcriptional regulator